MSYLKKAEELYSMIGQGQVLEAFEKFYHDDVVMIEATGEKREGKELNRKHEQQWMSNLKERKSVGQSAG